MGKKKANSRAKRKENNHKAASQNANSTNKQSNNVKSGENRTVGKAGEYQPQSVPKLTIYTVAAMFAALVAAGTTAFSMVILAKPINYAADSFFGDRLDSIYYDMVSEIMIEEGYDKLFVGLLAGAAAALVITAILSLVTVIRAVNPENKPYILMNTAAFVLSGIAVALYFGATSYINDKMGILGLENSPDFGIYRGYMVMLIVNTVILLGSILATMSGRARWKKDGKAF